jgi:predicted TPR repeat methyltransferase
MMGAAAFDARYRSEGDPWGYRSSAYEREKYAATLAACGAGPFRCALELGASIGVFSALLAPRCEALSTIDFSSVAVREARRELARFAHVRALVGEIPAALEDATHDLIVASEILYYLAPEALDLTLPRLERRLASGGRLVVVHWRPAGPERPFTAGQVHDRVRALPGLRLAEDLSTDAYLLHGFERT